ncbi:MAG: YitT family protein [Saprospiraceae bacterium]
MHKRDETKLTIAEIFTPRYVVFSLIGIAFAVFALEGFMIPNGFLDGGVTGISILLHEVYHINFSIIALCLNLLFILPAYKYIGKLFAIRYLISVIILSLGVEFIHFSAITSDKLLIAIFGGGLIGVGMGLVTRASSAFDGFEILAAFTTRRIGFSSSEIILFFNGIIFLTAAFEVGLESAMYSLITYFTAVKMADYVVDGIEEYIAVTIISKESELIKPMITNVLRKAITVYKGERGYLPGKEAQLKDVDIIVTVVTRFEIILLKEEIEKIDPDAFIYLNIIKETMGGIIKKRGGHVH